MKKILLATALLFASALSWAGPTDPNQPRVSQNNSNVPSNGMVTRYLDVPTNGDSCLWLYDGSSLLPDCATLGTGLSLTSRVINVSGITGAQGVQGVPGAQGVAGATGAAGSPGAPGTAGVTGATGAQGIQGVAGSAGATGATGAAGATGPQGIAGVSAATPAQSSASRALNSSFLVSATRGALVVYSVRITTTVSIGSNQDGDVVLEIATDSAFTTSVQTLSIGENGQTVALAIALNSIQASTVVVSGYVPAGYYVRLRTVNNTGSPSYAYRAGQEVLL